MMSHWADPADSDDSSSVVPALQLSVDFLVGHTSPPSRTGFRMAPLFRCSLFGGLGAVAGTMALLNGHNDWILSRTDEIPPVSRN